ncbi:MAG: DedA family protein [Candidatus Curtissbacteria bacterium]|nr:DedA family protein [Candidatus Curtissbacteria bacterium]
MNESILESIVFWVMGVISTLGYPGIFVLMALESALIPIPSEVIMPFSGFLVSQGRFDLLTVIVIGALGNLFGSWIAYALGYWGHERLVKKLVRNYGKFILLTEEEFDYAVNLFRKHGQWVSAIARVLPALRTIISLPAGISKLPFIKFSILTFFGSLIWSGLLTYIGVKLGENWEVIRPYFRKFDIVIVLITIIVLGAYIYHKLRKRKVSAKQT